MVLSSIHVNVPRVRVEDVDAHGISFDRLIELKSGARAESVAVLFGEPADRRSSCVPGNVVWCYPIRAWNTWGKGRDIVPAVLLRMRFDASGTLLDWGFFDPRTGHALPVVESSRHASRWYSALRHTGDVMPPQIRLNETLLRGRTTQADVERLLGQWHPNLARLIVGRPTQADLEELERVVGPGPNFNCGYGGPAPVVKKESTDSGSVWDWYVDRPSPLFAPPHYVAFVFDSTGALVEWRHDETYGYRAGPSLL